MKGIILAGGTGSRVWPSTKVVSKQLLPVYDKPTIYYPLSTLLKLGIKDVMVITNGSAYPHLLSLFKQKDGESNPYLGINFTFKIQTSPRGIAEALIIAEEWQGDDDVCLILGDNIFTGIEPEGEEKDTVHGGAMWARMPITALVGDIPLEEWPEPMAVHDAQPWDCSSHHNSVYVIDRATPCPWMAKIDGQFFPAKYLFTVDYAENEIADDPAQHKQSHVMQLLEAGEWTGNIVALPNNRVRVTHPAWFETGQGAPDFRPSAHIHYSKSDLDYTLDVNRIFDNLYAEEDE